MKQSTKHPGRLEIDAVRQLRQRILNGTLAPGERFPTRTQLQRELGIGWSPIQRAFNQLRDDGFVVTNGKGGTSVAPHPPHLTNFALVFPRSQQETRFWMTIRTATERLGRDEHRRITTRLLNEHDSISDENRKLEQDVIAHRIAGLILIWMDGQVGNDSPILTQTDMPRVVYATVPLRCPSVAFDSRTFFTRAFDHLLSQGRRRIAHLGIRNPRAKFDFKDLALPRGLSCPSYLDQQIGLSAPESARNVAHLLMTLSPDLRPDALIISDDHLVEHAQAGLIDAGVRVPDDLAVVAHCNYPTTAPAVLPITRLGFDCAALVRTMVERIDQQRNGLPTPPVTLLTAQFEHEYAVPTFPMSASGVAP